MSDTILKTVLSGILLFSSFQASAADNSGAVLMSQAQQTLRATFSDPTFPDSYYPGRALFEQKITKIRHPAGVGVLNEAAKALVQCHKSLTPDQYKVVMGDLLDSVDVVLPAIQTDAQGKLYSGMFKRYYGNDPRRHLKPKVFEAITTAVEGGPSDVGVGAIEYFLFVPNVIRNARTYPDYVERNLKPLAQLSNQEQIGVLRNWDRDRDNEFHFWFRAGIRGGYVTQMLNQLKNVKSREEALIMKKMGILMEIVHNVNVLAYTKEYHIAASDRTYKEDDERAQRLTNEIIEQMKRIRVENDNPRPYIAMALALEAFSQYKGDYIGANGQNRKEDVVEAYNGTGFFNELLLVVSRVRTDADMALWTHLVLTESDGVVIIDPRWVRQLGKYDTPDDVAKAREKFQVDSRTPFTPDWLSDPFNEKPKIVKPRRRFLPNLISALAKICGFGALSSQH